MNKEWKSLKDNKPEVGKLYDITNDSPFENEILNVHASVRCDFISQLWASFVPLNGDDSFNIKQANFVDWWFCDAEEISDPVNSPKHYNTDVGFECIDVIRLTLTKEQFRGFLLGNAIKYIWRHKLKGKSVEDLQKAEWYLHRSVEIGGDTEIKGILLDKLARLMHELEGK